MNDTSYSTDMPAGSDEEPVRYKQCPECEGLRGRFIVINFEYEPVTKHWVYCIHCNGMGEVEL